MPAADLDAAAIPDTAARRAGAGPAVLLLVGGALGLLAAMVLTIDRIRLLQNPATTLACNLNPFISCGPVMQSAQGSVFGFPNPLLGIIGFTVLVSSGAALLAGARFARWYWLGLQLGVLAAALFITWLQVQSVYVLHALCLWCILVWTVTIPIVVGVTVYNLAAGHFGRRLVHIGRVLRGYQLALVGVWYLLVIGAVALRFYREFALMWFGVTL